jgi:predicted dehydrogenase
MKVALVGCGLVGEKRARALAAQQLLIVADVDQERAWRVSQLHQPPALVARNWREAVSHPEVELVIVATPNNLLTPIGIFALKRGRHVFLEKPAARSVAELGELVKVAKKFRRLVKVGFNLRYHPAIKKAREIVASGEIGPLMYLRGRYGHGGRVGYQKEWRATPEVAGGGELIDQGIHLIDLARWFLGEFTKVFGSVKNYFWKMPVEDNAFLLLQTKNGQTAWLHVSCTEWKNLFSLEIFGRSGKLQIDGLSGSYGREKLTLYKMLPQMGPPPESIWEFPGPDESWQNELDDFIDCLENDRPVNGGLKDAYEALKIIGKIYQRGKK